MHPRGKKTFHGTTTIGEKGQVVVPASARKAMNVAKGEKLLVFGVGADMLVLSKLSHMEQFAEHLAKKLKTMKDIIKKNS